MMSTKIVFNKPYFSGNELAYIEASIRSGKISGDGIFTKKCINYFNERYRLNGLLTTSCTDALEMASILANIQPGDEVIAPSYTFVSTVNAFMLRGAKIQFIDSGEDDPNIDAWQIESKITKKTKLIVPVHYAGVACNMDLILEIAKKYNLMVIEDAAQAIDSYYKKKPLGSFGDLATFSFHESKNIISGEGGMLVINNSKYYERAEIIREKGTNRAQFFRGEINKYGWKDIGSSFLPSDIIAAYLFSQLECLNDIQSKRKLIWQRYYDELYELEIDGFIKRPIITDYATNNAHMFYIICNNLESRSRLIEFLKFNKIMAVFHYSPLHKSEYYLRFNPYQKLKNAEKYDECLLRLPLFYELTGKQQDYIISKIQEFFRK